MAPDLNSPLYPSAVAVSPLQTKSSAGVLSTPNLAAASPSSLTYPSGNRTEAQSSLHEAQLAPQRTAGACISGFLGAHPAGLFRWGSLAGKG